MALLFKRGVTLTPHPAGARLLGSLDRVARIRAADLTVTSGSDGHPATSSHGRGRAFDVRTHGLTDIEKVELLNDVLDDLDDGQTTTLTIAGIWWARATDHWFGQIEAHGQPNEHLHLQLRNGRTFPY